MIDTYIMWLCFCIILFFFFKQKTAYEMRISDWSSDVCSSDLHIEPKNMTVLCTYQCTAACKQCCFESSPHIKGRLSGDVIRKRITEAHQAFPSIKVDRKSVV